MTALPAKIGVTPPAIRKSSAAGKTLLETFPNAFFNDTGRYFAEKELIAFLNGADAVLLGRDPVNENVLNALPNLRMVAKYGVGLDNIDQDAMQRRGVALGFTAGVNKLSVAEMTVGFMLGLCHNIFTTGFALKQNNWVKDGGHQLSGKIVGIVGCGNVGKEVVRLLRPFDCRALTHDILDMTAFCQAHEVEETGFDDLLSRSDIVTLHLPLTEKTANMIDARVFQKMKTGAFLVNTSRGGIVNEKDLKQALLAGDIAGAALDVFAQEPPADNGLLACPNLMATPHIGGNSVEATSAMAQSAVASLVEFFKK